jgi:hypothetical protein
MRPKFAFKTGRYKVSAKEDRTFDNIVFDSKWELETYKLLKTHLPADVKIHRQVEFLLQPKFKNAEGKAIREINYVSDFLITRQENLIANELPADALVIDSKGHLTDIFKLKNKMFMYKYAVVIQQVKRPADVMSVIDKFKLMQ